MSSLFASTTFRPYRGPFSLNLDLSHPSGIAITGRSSGTFDPFQVNEAGRITGTAVSSQTSTTTVSAPGFPPESATESFSDTEVVSGALYDYLVSTESFATAQARISYSFQASGNSIVFRFTSHEIIQNFVIEGVPFSGTADTTGSLTAPFNEARSVHSQTFESLLPANAFVGWSGLDTVEYTHSRGRVIADLHSGNGVNGFGGTDTYSSIENLTGSSFNDILAGDAQGNVFFGGPGNDILTGRLGRDVAEFANTRATYTIDGAGATATVTGPEGVDTLDGIERVHFSDRNVALDLASGESAGMTVRLIGAAFDRPNIVPEFVGIGIDLFDAGMSMLQVAELALSTPLFLSIAGSRSNVDVVNTLYRNIAGVLPSASERDPLVGLLQGSGGTMTQAELLVLAANIAPNEVNIDLVGLQQSGVEFI